MFGGDVITVKIELLNKNTITYVVDLFGSNARIYYENDKLYALIKCNNEAFFYWALQYQDNIKVLSPDTLVKRIIESLSNNIKKYQ